MTGKDDGGFSPHPGDPWHPSWRSDDEPSDEIPPRPSDDDADESEPKRRRGLFGRRKRDERDESEIDESAEFEPPEDAPDADAVPEASPPLDFGGAVDDPFDAVLRAEGRSVRRRPVSGGDAPVPAWTSDDEIPDEVSLPVSPPSWVGDSTATDPAIESTGFEPAESPQAVEPPPAQEPAEQPDLFEAEPVATDVVEDEPVAIPAPEAGEPAVVGEYGVAGPEAFDALADTAEEDLGDWEAFMEGTAAEPPAAAPASFGAPAEPVGDADTFDEWVESEPEQKRRWFRRRSKDEAASSDDWDADEWRDDEVSPAAAIDDRTFEEEPLTEPAMARDDTVFMPPVEPQSDEEDDTVDEAAVAQALAALGAVDEESVVAEVGFDDPAEGMEFLSEEATAVEVPADEVVWSADHGEVAWAEHPVEEEARPEVAQEADDLRVDLPADDLVEPAAEQVLDEAIEEPFEAVGEMLSEDQPQLVGEAMTDEPQPVEAGVPDEPQPVEEARPFFLGELPDDAGAEPVREEPADWDGDPSRVPSSWFADIDEDTVVPPVAADTPETEWPAGEGRWEGRAAWEMQEPTEVFDVEEAEVPTQEAVVEPVETEPVIPEGYQHWGDAVAEVTRDVGEDTAEYHVQHVEPVEPVQPGIPEGFEPFPGTEAAAAYGDASRRPESEWMGDTTDETPVVDYDDDEPDFDEQIYTGGGTIEHRGLAEAIAAVGEDDDTEWQAMSAAMPGVETGVLGFDDVADLASGDAYVAPVRSNFGMRVLTGLLLAAFLVGSLFVGSWAFALFVGAIVLLGLGEMYATLSRHGYLPLTVFGMIGAAGTLAATWFHGPIAIPAGVMLTAVVVFFFYAFAPTRRDALTNGGVTVLGLAWVIGGVSFAIPIGRSAEFETIVMAIVVTTAAMDIGAYTFGRRFGRRPLAPILSPNKTFEGLFGGALAALVVAGLIGWRELGPFDLTGALALGAVVVIAAPLGDLAESMVKRAMGVKDMGSTLPGHGGVLDRIDALVFVIPAAWVLLEVAGYLV